MAKKCVLLYMVLILSNYFIYSCGSLSSRRIVERDIKQGNLVERINAFSMLAQETSQGKAWALKLTDEILKGGNLQDKIDLIRGFGRLEQRLVNNISKKILFSTLNASEPKIRVTTAIALGNLEVGDDEIINELLKALGDTDIVVRYGVFDALTKVSDEDRVIRILLETIKETSKEIWPGTTVTVMDYSFASYGNKLLPYIPDLCELLSHPEATYTNSILEIIAMLGPIAKDSKDCVEKLSITDDKQIKYWADSALLRIQGIE